jgi:hypothetical protein
LSRSDRSDRPAWGWRLLAWTVLIFVVLMPLPTVLAAGPKTWATPAINWIAVVGAFSYAYGREPRFLLFWRVFALPFSFYTVATLGIMVGRVADYARHDPRPTPVAAWIIVAAAFVVCFAVCIALLRHSELLRSRQRSVKRRLEGVFA